MNSKLKEYFDKIAMRISEDGQTFGDFPDHRGLKGANREEIILDFLQGHLGNTFDCYRNVQIMDSSGRLSREIDIVITNKLSYTLNTNKTKIVLLESIVAVFSIKSILDKDAVQDSFDLFKSIPEFSEDIIKINQGWDANYLESIIQYTI